MFWSFIAEIFFERSSVGLKYLHIKSYAYLTFLHSPIQHIPIHLRSLAIMTQAFISSLPLRRSPLLPSSATPRQPRHHVFSMTAMSPPNLLSFSPAVTSLENEGAYAVMAAANELEKATGERVVHLEIGQPGFATPSHISDAGISAIQSGLTKYSPPPGTTSLRDAIADWAVQNRGLDVTARNVIVGPGAKPGLFFTTLALVRAGDEVIIPDPGFPTYQAMVEVAGGVPVNVGLDKYGGGYDMEKLERALESGKVRMVVINSPGNPTGGVMGMEAMQRLAQLAREKDFWVLSDEIYSQLIYAGGYTSIGSLEGMLERTIVVDGFSKTWSMTGWRLGWAIMPEKLAERVELLMVHAVGCTATFTQQAGIAALTGEMECVNMMREEYKKRRDIVVEGVNAMDGVKCEVPEGAFYAWVDVSELGKGCKEVASLMLQEGRVAVLPGVDFGDGGEGYIRLSYVAEEEEIREGIRRMGEVVKKIRSGAL